MLDVALQSSAPAGPGPDGLGNRMPGDGDPTGTRRVAGSERHADPDADADARPRPSDRWRRGEEPSTGEPEDCLNCANLDWCPDHQDEVKGLKRPFEEEEDPRSEEVCEVPGCGRPATICPGSDRFCRACWDEQYPEPVPGDSPPPLFQPPKPWLEQGFGASNALEED